MQLNILKWKNLHEVGIFQTVQWIGEMTFSSLVLDQLTILSLKRSVTMKVYLICIKSGRLQIVSSKEEFSCVILVNTRRIFLFPQGGLTVRLYKYEVKLNKKENRITVTMVLRMVVTTG